MMRSPKKPVQVSHTHRENQFNPVILRPEGANQKRTSVTPPPPLPIRKEKNKEEKNASISVSKKVHSKQTHTQKGHERVMGKAH